MKLSARIQVVCLLQAKKQLVSFLLWQISQTHCFLLIEVTFFGSNIYFYKRRKKKSWIQNVSSFAKHCQTKVNSLFCILKPSPSLRDWKSPHFLKIEIPIRETVLYARCFRDAFLIGSNSKLCIFCSTLCKSHFRNQFNFKCSWIEHTFQKSNVWMWTNCYFIYWWLDWW